ncbi:DUF971 domain-containing protein [bacterium]|nr:DUF971 domain-containing protein [bacterium]
MTQVPAKLSPRDIKLTQERELRITWSDGHITRFPLQVFRDECPCASCSGESDIFGEVKMPVQLPIARPGKYDLKSLTPIGNYAVAAVWGDGHDSGIYSWEYLLQMEDKQSATANNTDNPTDN